jgi:hypothetical protein
VKILTELKALGYSIILEGENIRLRYLGMGAQPAEAAPLIRELKEKKAEAVAYLKETRPLPYFDLDGSVVIPFDSDPKYHWWHFGQLPSETAKEVRTWKH